MLTVLQAYNPPLECQHHPKYTCLAWDFYKPNKPFVSAKETTVLTGSVPSQKYRDRDFESPASKDLWTRLHLHNNLERVLLQGWSLGYLSPLQLVILSGYQITCRDLKHQGQKNNNCQQQKLKPMWKCPGRTNLSSSGAVRASALFTLPMNNSEKPHSAFLLADVGPLAEEGTQGAFLGRHFLHTYFHLQCTWLHLRSNSKQWWSGSRKQRRRRKAEIRALVAFGESRNSDFKTPERKGEKQRGSFCFQNTEDSYREWGEPSSLCAFAPRDAQDCFAH